MNHSAYRFTLSGVHAGSSFYKSMASAAFCSLAALAPAAHADVIDFEGLGNDLIFSGDSFEQHGLRLGGTDANGASGSLVGAIIDGSDSDFCSRLACPTGNAGNYYGGLNDGILGIHSMQGGGTFKVQSFDASFIISDIKAPAGRMIVQGFYGNGSTLSQTFDLPQPTVFLGTLFHPFRQYYFNSAMSALDFTGMQISALSCDTTGACGFGNNQGQFGLDNLNFSISAVPEPSTYAMLLLGLVSIAAVARRRA
ncbi:NF038120 family PEP-CTERM protein [Janthinobacterium rivuli]|uniref:NF038120 family PEP-CTERM protein n=1 Tax=Janthinobacterium sp. FT68W TaxID=2654255 RepID=UPI001D0324C0|nr:NF038120 family PEP-CTERM protein [Janthinobacterium sp. FT68W]